MIYNNYRKKKMPYSNVFHKFYQSLDQLELLNVNIDSKRQQVKTCIEDYHLKVQNISIDPQLIKQNPSLTDLLNTTLEELKNTSQSWIQHLQDSLKQEKLRSELENHFILILFGKVKAGKSSLGNFIAQQSILTEPPVFFSYDKAGNKQTVQSLQQTKETVFAIDNLECTDQIQGFKLSSLACIDTPGLGSMVMENGQLSEQYIDAADYIIFPTSSDSVGQADELKQLEGLFKRNKKVTLCITKSDITETDEVNGEIVYTLNNKSTTDRNLQEAYLQKEIKKLLPEHHHDNLIGDILSISTKTAEQALLEKNETHLEQSNMPLFYQLLTRTIEEKAQKLKSSTPYDGLNTLISQTILGTNTDNDSHDQRHTLNANQSSVKQIHTALKQLKQNIEQSITTFDELFINIQHDLNNEIESVVSQYTNEIEQNNLQTMLNTIDHTIDHQIDQLLDTNIRQIFSEFTASVKQFSNTVNISQFSIEEQSEEIAYRVETSGVIRKVLNILSFGLVSKEYKTIREQITLGDNKIVVLQDYKKQRLAQDKEKTIRLSQMFKESFFYPMQDIHTELENNIKHFEQQINDLLTS